MPFLKNNLTPPGCNPLREDDRKPIIRVITGDTWEIRAMLFAADGGPAGPKNSHVEFVLSENQFSPPLWNGSWYAGIIPYENRPGFVSIVIPHDFTKTLRRGSYQFSLRVSDLLRQTFNTQLQGNFLVEYAPTSDQHSIPYRDGTSDHFCSEDEHENVKKEKENRIVYLQDESDGTYHKVSLLKEAETNMVVIGVHQQGIVL